jgi:hypothetical protein
VDYTLPNPTANAVLGWNATATAIINMTGSGGTPADPTFLTVNDETATLPHARRLVAGDGTIVFDDSVPGVRSARAIIPPTLKIPSLMNLNNIATIKPIVYDSADDWVYGGDPTNHHVIRFDPGSLGIATTLTASGYDKVTAMCVTPHGSPGSLIFLGRNDSKLSIMSGYDTSLTVDAASLPDMDGCMVYDPVGDLVYSIGGAHAGNWVLWGDATTGANIGHVALAGSTVDDPQLKANALAAGPDGTVCWISAATPARFNILSPSHVHGSFATAFGSTYAALGALIFGNSATHVWAFCANGPTTVIQQVNMGGVSDYTVQTGLPSGDCYLTHDPTLDRIHFSIGGSIIGVFDIATKKVLGTFSKGLATTTWQMAYDPTRQFLWQGNASQGYSNYQM